MVRPAKSKVSPVHKNRLNRDQIEALAPEREALWTRLEKASFLTDDEKRSAAGYGPKPITKFNPWHGDRGRFVSGPDGGSEKPILVSDEQPALKRLHPDTTYATDRLAKGSLDYWRQQPTEKIIESLKPGASEPLLVKPDGTVMNGNTRLKALEERGVDGNRLPREILPAPSLESAGRSPRGGGAGGGGGGGGGVGGPKLPRRKNPLDFLF